LKAEVLEGDCLKVLVDIPNASIDALLTDPPAGISFMGKKWDSNKGGRNQWIVWLTGVAKECLRVLKPGAHGLVWALPRTSHWTATALEDAGFEIRDVITHHFGTGFPKSHNVGDGWGTALKPATENWILVRKPLGEKNIAANVLEWETGAINIDGTRIGFRSAADEHESKQKNRHADFKSGPRDNHVYGQDMRHRGDQGNYNPSGRWPANLILSHHPDCDGVCVEGCPIRLLDRQNGASRFFYCAKPSRKERDNGGPNNHPTVKSLKLMQYLCRIITPPDGIVLDPFAGTGTTGIAALQEGFSFIGIEQDKEYCALAHKRIEAANAY